MAAYCRVYDSRHLQADCLPAPEPYARQSSMGCLYLCLVLEKADKRGQCYRRLRGQVTGFVVQSVVASGDERTNVLHTCRTDNTLVARLAANLRPVWAPGRCRISPPRFLTECCKRQLNQGSFFHCILGCLLFLICTEFVYLYFICMPSVL